MPILRKRSVFGPRDRIGNEKRPRLRGSLPRPQPGGRATFWAIVPLRICSFLFLRNDLGEFGGVAHCRTCPVRNASGGHGAVAHLNSARVRNAELGSEALRREFSVQKWSKEPRRVVGGSICLWGAGITGYIGDRQLLLEGKLRDLFVFAYTTGSVCPLYAPTGVPIPARVGREMTLPSECVSHSGPVLTRLIHLVVVVVTVGMWKSD
jgi:hypothetical protein